jgi:hypothetical protein
MYINDGYAFLVDMCDHVSFNASSGATYSGFKGFWVFGILFCTAMIECDTQIMKGLHEKWPCRFRGDM